MSDNTSTNVAAVVDIGSSDSISRDFTVVAPHYTVHRLADRRGGEKHTSSFTASSRTEICNNWSHTE